ncbi:MAG: crotonase/enoyl-CoA hydratase family protein [Proteobacteria bacterium]|nr:crotonase/enoyl-CoA hydratase family protein [Pseudomonadota bacterium]HQR04984.1 crotonase/enoyl-CoA hydratase family protein [Rhodocyclaceae bacterium]
MYNTLSTHLENRVLTLHLNRPAHLNAFTVEMAHELEAFFRQVGNDDAVGAVVVTGAGRAFCAGMELAREDGQPGNVFGLDETQHPTLEDMHARIDDPAIRDGVRDTGGRVTLAIHDCRKPVIAAINGPAVGIGATMTLAMDFRLASRTARIGFVFGRLGIVPEACSSWFLPRLVGSQTALEWALTADIISAETAQQAGLLRSIHDDTESLLAEAHALAHRIIDGRSPAAIALTRQMMRRNPALPSPLEAHRIESLAMFYSSIGDGREGVAAFLEKRSPRFDSTASALPSFYPWWE